MQVKITKLGFIFNHRVRPDEIIDVPENMFSDKWMEKIETSSPSISSKPVKKKEEEVKNPSSSSEVI